MTRSSCHRALFAALALLCGCSAGPKMHPVNGRITFPDGTPLPEGSIELQAKDAGARQWHPRAAVNKDGSFSVTTVIGDRERKGAPQGTYDVIVVSVTGRGQSRIDPRFMDFATSGLTVTVQPGNNECPFEVTKPPRLARRP